MIAAAWIAILALTGGFQFFRGAPVDACVFLALALALLLDAAGAFRRLPSFSWAPPRYPLLAAAVIAAGVLAFTPRHGLADGIVFAVGGLLVLFLAWPTRAPAASPAAGSTRTAILWSAALVAVCIWELTMYLLGTFVGGRTAFPALSDLLDPLVENPIGRILFVAVWILGGVGLLRRGEQR